MPGFLHLYVGQEAVAVGVCEALRIDDYITSTHRGHGHLVAKGGDFSRMMAELMGKATGYCGGKGGSMHINDLSLGCSAPTASSAPACRSPSVPAFRNKYLGTDQVSVDVLRRRRRPTSARSTRPPTWRALCTCPSCSSARTTGTASTRRRDKPMVISDIVDRAARLRDAGRDRRRHGRAGRARGDGRSGRARRGAAKDRRWSSAKTYRYYNHHGIQNLGLKYRPDEEVLAWKERDPIFNFEDT